MKLKTQFVRVLKHEKGMTRFCTGWVILCKAVYCAIQDIVIYITFIAFRSVICIRNERHLRNKKRHKEVSVYDLFISAFEQNWRYNANVTPQSDCQWYGTNLLLNTFLPGLSKGKARVEIPASFFFFVQLQIAVKFLNTHERRSDACLTFWLISSWHGVMAEEERFIRAKSAQILCIIRSKRIQIMHKAFAVDSR